MIRPAPPRGIGPADRVRAGEQRQADAAGQRCRQRQERVRAAAREQGAGDRRREAAGDAGHRQDRGQCEPTERDRVANRTQRQRAEEVPNDEVPVADDRLHPAPVGRRIGSRRRSCAPCAPGRGTRAPLARRRAGARSGSAARSTTGRGARDRARGRAATRVPADGWHCTRRARRRAVSARPSGSRRPRCRVPRTGAPIARRAPGRSRPPARSGRRPRPRHRSSYVRSTPRYAARMPRSTPGPLILVGGAEFGPGNEPHDRLWLDAAAGRPALGPGHRGGPTGSRSGRRLRAPLVRAARCRRRGAARPRPSRRILPRGRRGGARRRRVLPVRRRPGLVIRILAGSRRVGGDRRRLAPGCGRGRLVRGCDGARGVEPHPGGDVARPAPLRARARPAAERRGRPAPRRVRRALGAAPPPPDRRDRPPRHRHPAPRPSGGHASAGASRGQDAWP